jgi:hypothetical protein
MAFIERTDRMGMQHAWMRVHREVAMQRALTLYCTSRTLRVLAILTHE